MEYQDGRPFLAIPRRGPALLVFAVHPDIEYGYGGQVFIKVGSRQARARHDRSPESHQLACRGRACVLSLFDVAGVAVMPFKLD